MQSKRFKAITLGLSLITMLAAGRSNAEQVPDVVQIMKTHEAALVTVKYVLAVNMGQRAGNQEQENENELTCSMISADGLIICSNNQLSGFMDLIKRFSGPAGSGMSATPKDLKVLVDAGTESLGAEIVARDTELDIVWIRITDAGERSFPYFDFTRSTDAGIGDRIITIRRTGNSFGRTPVVSQTRIGGISSKPRKLFIPETPSAVGMGLPVFATDGRIIGLMVTQLPEDGDTAGPAMGMLGSGMANLQDAMSGLVLPATEVVKATQRASEIDSP